MRRIREALRGLLLDVWENDLEVDSETVSPVSVRDDGDPAAHRGSVDRDLLLPRDELQRRVEARREARGEELLGVRAGAGSAHSLGDREVECQLGARDRDVSVASRARGQCFCRVESVHPPSLTRMTPPRGHGR